VNLRHVKSFDSAPAKGLGISTEGVGSLSKPSSHLHSPINPGFDKDAKDVYYYSDDDEDEFGNKRSAVDGDGEIQMTFGRWDEPPPPPKTVSTYDYGYAGGSSGAYGGADQRVAEIPKGSSSHEFGATGGTTFSSSSWNTVDMSKNANTHAHLKEDKVAVETVVGGLAGLTVGMAAMSMSESSTASPKNVWANNDYYDDYDEDEFAEKEVTMSFA